MRSFLFDNLSFCGKLYDWFFKIFKKIILGGEMSKEKWIIDLIGNKAERLSVLISNGFLVKRFIPINVIKTAIIISKQEIPDQLIEGLKENLSIGLCGVAVRSSAVGEDGVLSWAGQFKTNLFVSEDELYNSILDCANTQDSEIIETYAQMHGVKVPELALFVQEMVDAEYSGVLFTTNPMKEGDDEMIMEVVEGVAEDLVNGSSQPTRYSVDSHSGEVTLESKDEDDLKFPAKYISELVEIGKKLHVLFGEHQDIEWSIEKETGKIYLNQSRNITTQVEMDKADLDELNSVVVKDVDVEVTQELERLKALGLEFSHDVLSDQNIAEIITPHPCQMTFGLFTYLFAHGEGAIKLGRSEMGYDIGHELDRDFFYLVGGQPRCSIIHDAFTYRIKGIPIEDYCQIIEYYLQRIDNDVSLANYPEVVLYNQNPSSEFLVDLFGEKKGDLYHDLYDSFFQNFRKIEESLDQECREGFLTEWKLILDSCMIDVDYDNVIDMSKRYEEIADLLRTEACKAFVKAARVGFFAYARLRNLLEKLFGEKGDEYSSILTSGIPLELNSNLRFSIELAKIKEGIQNVEEVLDEFGHLAMHELDISVPRYSDQPKLMQSIADRISKGLESEFESSFDKSQQLKKELLEKAGDYRDELEQEIDVARRYLPLREEVKFEYLRGYALLRKLAVGIGKKLGWNDGLIFYLYPEEVFTIYKNFDLLKPQVEERLKMYNKHRMLYIPSVVQSNNLEKIGKYGSDDSSLRGIGVTNFTTEGRVVVINDLEDEESFSLLKPGSILVTVTTDPAWSPMLSIIGSGGGLITEVGGLLAHGAIYAREARIAAVLNVPNATRILRTGMKVRVNGAQGCIEILP